MIISDNFNDIYKKIIKDVFINGEISAPRGMKIKELLGYSFRLTNPRNSLCTLKDRKLNYKFAMIEKFEYMAGTSCPDRIVHYNKNMNSFINEKTRVFDGSYGPRLGRQFEYVYDLLKKDPDTRQAVLNINNESDKHETKDVPCTIALQLLLRQGKLHMVAYMRSNDLLWGTPYDVNGFCFIQEVFASFLGVELGTYTHVAGSLHLYTEREEQLTKLLISNEVNDEKNDVFNLSFYEAKHNFQNFWILEEEIRCNVIPKENVKLQSNYQDLSVFFKNAVDKLL